MGKGQRQKNKSTMRLGDFQKQASTGFPMGSGTVNSVWKAASSNSAWSTPPPAENPWNNSGSSSSSPSRGPSADPVSEPIPQAFPAPEFPNADQAAASPPMHATPEVDAEDSHHEAEGLEVEGGLKNGMLRRLAPTQSDEVIAKNRIYVCPLERNAGLTSAAVSRYLNTIAPCDVWLLTIPEKIQGGTVDRFLGIFDNYDVPKNLWNTEHIIDGKHKVRIVPFKAQGKRNEDEAKDEVELIEFIKNHESHEQKMIRCTMESGGSVHIPPGESRTFKFKLQNRHLQPATLERIVLFPFNRDFEVLDSVARKYKKQSSKRLPSKGRSVIDNKKTHTFEVRFRPQSQCVYGKHKIGVYCCFERAVYKHEFEVVVMDKQMYEKLKSKSEFKRVEPDMLQRHIIPAFPVGSASGSHFHTDVETKWVRKLPDYPVPPKVQGDVDEDNRYSQQVPWKMKESYVERLHGLLFTEEAQLVKELRMYDLRRTQFTRVRNVVFRKHVFDYAYQLSVKSLAEGRPSILIGDEVFAWIDGTQDYEYQGYVYKIGKDFIVVKFSDSIDRHVEDTSVFWNVRFGFKRIFQRRLHYAVDETDKNIAWPSSSEEDWRHLRSIDDSEIANDIRGPSSDIRDQEINTNLRQRMFVNYVNWCAKAHLQNGRNGNSVALPPFILGGAFGTGKTRTLIDLIRQVSADMSNSILVCAEANSACDLIVRQLSPYLGPRRLYRQLAFHRARSTVPPEIFKYTGDSYDDEAAVFNTPSANELEQYSVIVCTASTASNLYGVGLGPGSFTHIFIDEAAQMTEPQGLIPLCMAAKNTVIVLSGDKRQVGPRVLSKSCRHHGLHISLLEQFEERLQRQLPPHLHRSFIFDLVETYRSPAPIMELASQLFYNGSLECRSNPAQSMALAKWSKLEREVPLLFISVQGEDTREGDSPSFFNLSEVFQVNDVLMSLVDEMKLSLDDIAVLSPYRKQMEKIRELLRENNMGRISVGGIETIQGAERKVIVISTVRSSSKKIGYDRKYDVGFFNEKRLCTALTRAKCLVVIIGDHTVLAANRFWNSLILYCKAKANCTGADIPNAVPLAEHSSANIDDSLDDDGAGYESSSDARSEGTMEAADNEYDEFDAGCSPSRTVPSAPVTPAKDQDRSSALEILSPTREDIKRHQEQQLREAREMERLAVEREKQSSSGLQRLPPPALEDDTLHKGSKSLQPAEYSTFGGSPLEDIPHELERASQRSSSSFSASFDNLAHADDASFRRPYDAAPGDRRQSHSPFERSGMGGSSTAQTQRMSESSGWNSYQRSAHPFAQYPPYASEPQHPHQRPGSIPSLYTRGESSSSSSSTHQSDFPHYHPGSGDDAYRSGGRYTQPSYGMGAYGVAPRYPQSQAHSAYGRRDPYDHLAPSSSRYSQPPHDARHESRHGEVPAAAASTATSATAVAAQKEEDPFKCAVTFNERPLVMYDRQTECPPVLLRKHTDPQTKLTQLDIYVGLYCLEPKMFQPMSDNEWSLLLSTNTPESCEAFSMEREIHGVVPGTRHRSRQRNHHQQHTGPELRIRIPASYHVVDTQQPVKKGPNNDAIISLREISAYNFADFRGGLPNPTQQSGGQSGVW